LKIIGNSDIGKVRKENQDAFWIHRFDDQSCIAVVCDGMGGARGGQQASSFAIETVRAYFEDKSSSEKIKKSFDKVVSDCNKLVFEQSNQNEALYGMGTTMVMVYIKDKTAYFSNIGDSRAYHIKNGSICQITKDHSAVQELVDSGHITERQAKIHPNKNVITRAIGIEENIEYDYFESAVSPGDIILLCTDGLTNNVDENEIQFEASGGDFEDLSTRLIELANHRGGTDNITVAAVQI
jgi:protein phosphatase